MWNKLEYIVYINYRRSIVGLGVMVVGFMFQQLIYNLDDECENNF